MKVLVLGCGPAGLIAAHAAATAQCDVLIYSKARKSHMNGAQYLHRPIPMANNKPPFKISYQLSGSVEGYRDKVYGERSGVKVSPESLVGESWAWDIREAYDWLWNTYGEYVQDFDAYPESVASLLRSAEPDLVISTVPAPLLCHAGHAFTSTTIWSSDMKMGHISDNTVLCNGEPYFGWYRTSLIQGWANTEWPQDTKPPIPQHRLWEVTKPIDTTCTCFPEIIRMGRYGRWAKGVLSHQAWEETWSAIERKQEELHGATSS